MDLKSKKSNEIDLSVIYSQLNYPTLTRIIDICFAENLIVNREIYKHIKDFFDFFKVENFDSDIQREAAAFIIKFVLKEKIDNNLLSANNLIVTKLLSVNGRYSEVIPEILDGIQPISDDEIRGYCDYISTQIKYIHIFSNLPALQQMIFDLQNGDYSDIDSMIRNRFEPTIDKLNYSLKSVKNGEMSKYNDFDLSKDSLENIMTATWRMRSTPGASIKTGIKELNKLLGGEGYESGRIYLYAAVAGKWKSGTLLNTALWARDYNQNVECFDPTKKPCALYLSIENDNFETFERILSNRMKEDIKDLDSIRDFKDESEITEFIRAIQDKNVVDNRSLNDEHFQIFFKYRSYMSVDFNDIDVMLDELEGQGYECKIVVVDYVNRMRSITREIEEIQRLGSIVTQGSEFAKRRKLPVVTATQLTRGAMLKIEEALRSGRKASGSDLGGADIGKCWAMYENADCFILGNPETIVDDTTGNTQEFYMFKRSKLRGKKTNGRDTFYQPFIKDNGMALKEDEGLETSFAVFNLGDTFETNMASGNKKLGNYLKRKAQQQGDRVVTEIPRMSNREAIENKTDFNGEDPFDTSF